MKLKINHKIFPRLIRLGVRKLNVQLTWVRENNTRKKDMGNLKWREQFMN